MKKGRNKIIIVLMAALTFGSLAATAAHMHHHKKCHHLGAAEKEQYNCFFGEENEGPTEGLTEEQH